MSITTKKICGSTRVKYDDERENIVETRFESGNGKVVNAISFMNEYCLRSLFALAGGRENCGSDCGSVRTAVCDVLQ